MFSTYVLHIHIEHACELYAVYIVHCTYVYNVFCNVQVKYGCVLVHYKLVNYMYHRSKGRYMYVIEGVQSQVIGIN